MDPLGQLGVGQAAVAHQFAQDRPVAVVEFFDSHNVSRFSAFFAYHADHEGQKPKLGGKFLRRRRIMAAPSKGELRC